MSISTRRGGVGRGVGRKYLLFLGPYSPAVASIVEFHVELHGGMKVHAGY
jgi:hypothetical protein